MRAKGFLVLGLLLGRMALAGVPSPGEVLGKPLGQDRVLASYEETLVYLRQLAASSPRVALEELGPTVEGRPMLGAVISSEANMARLAAIRAGWAKLADPRGLSPKERERLVRELPVGVLVTAGIHATEVAGPLSALLFIHELATAPPETPLGRWLAQVVVLVVPSLNPDGQEMVVSWYRRWLGTPYEGALPPWLYHRYAGHDNNRDFVFLTQPESRNLNRFVYHRWHPQLFVDLHQMGPSGPRQFVPPFADPINTNLPPVLWRLTSHLGTLMALRLEQAGKAGVVSGWTFDGHWIGGTRNTAWWKNIVGVLTETASAALATPIWVDAADLRGGGKGLWEYRPQVNFPNPWPGGRWGLAEAVSYQRELLRAAVEFAATYRSDLLRETSAMALAACEPQGKPWGWALPPTGDPGRRQQLVRLLLEAGAELFAVEEAGGGLAAGTVVVPRGQPLGRFLWEVLERQSYPEVIPAPGADILVPYDVTAWNLPLMLGVEVTPLAAPPAGKLAKLSAPPQGFEGKLASRVVALPSTQLELSRVANEALRRGVPACRLLTGTGELPPGSLVLTAARETLGELLAGRPVAPVPLAATPENCAPLRQVRVGVLHPFTPVEDAGWLRWVFEQGGFPVAVLEPSQVAEGKLQGVDVLVLPDLEGKRLVDGPAPGLVPLPPEFRAGVGSRAGEQLKAFLERGGTVLAFQRAAEWVAEALQLEVSNALRGVDRGDFFAPGSLVWLELEPDSPLAWGLPRRVAAMVEGAVAFSSRPTPLGQREVVARFPDGPLLASGFLRGEEKLRRKIALLALQVGQGRVVLASFAPHFRGQTAHLFPLLYNAAWLPAQRQESQRQQSAVGVQGSSRR